MKHITAIDPDLRKSGVCRINENGKILVLESLEITKIILHISEYPDDEYVIEDVNKIKAMYSRGVKTNNTRIAQNVGMCKAIGTMIIELVTNITRRKPTLAPVGLGKQVKQNADLFKELTGYMKQTNEDKRDAWAIANWYLKTQLK